MKSDTFVCTFENTLRFEIKIESRVTILYGKSGTGKTTFIECITDKKDPETRVDVMHLSYEANIDPVKYLRLNDLAKYAFIDEESANEFDRYELLESILDAGYYLVIATRKPLENLTFGVGDVYKLQTIDQVTTVVPYYDKYDKLPECEHYSCEDSNSGYQYWSCFLSVSAMRGNRDWRNHVSNGLIMDGAALGNQIRDILNCTDTIYLPESFEFLLLQHYCNYTHEDGISDITTKDKTFERLYTRLVEQNKVLGFKYNKHALPSRVKLVKVIPELQRYANKWLQSRMTPTVLKDTNKQASRKELSEFLKDIGLQSEFRRVYDKLPDMLDAALWKVEVLDVLKTLHLF